MTTLTRQNVRTKLSTRHARRRCPAIFQQSQPPALGLTCCIFCILSFVLHAWQEPFKSRFSVLQLLIAIARLLQRFESVCRWPYNNLGYALALVAQSHAAHAG